MTERFLLGGREGRRAESPKPDGSRSACAMRQVARVRTTPLPVWRITLNWP